MAPSSRAAVSALVLPALVLALSPTPTPLYGINAQPEIFSGILIGGILLFFTAIGLSCVASIATPSVLHSTPLPAGKEY